MTKSINNSTTANTSLITTTSPVNQFDDKQLTMTFIGNIEDKKITSEKVISTNWKEVKGDLINKHEVREEKDGMAFIGASFLSNDDDGVELVENNDGVVITEDNGDKIVKRVGSNIIKYHMLTLDYDDGMTVDEAKERFGELEHLGYTSHNHKKDGIEKFRLVFPLTDPVSPDDIRNRKDDILSWAESADKSTLFIGRFFYLPSCPKNRLEHAEVWCNDGKLLDLLSFEVNVNQSKKVNNTTKLEPTFTPAVKEAIKNGLKQIGAVKHDPYFKIAASMFNGGMTQQDFCEVSLSLKPHHEQSDWLAQWKHSCKLSDISGGYVVNLLKEHEIFVYNDKKTKNDDKQTELLNDEINLITRKIDAVNESTQLTVIEKKKEVKVLTGELLSKEEQLDGIINEDDDLVAQITELLMQRLVYYVMDTELLHEYISEQGIWVEYKVSAFFKGEPILMKKGASTLFLYIMKQMGRSYRTKTLSASVQPDYMLNMFRKDHWLQPVEGDYHEVFDILLRSLGDNKSENIRHLKEVIAWKYNHPEDYSLSCLVIFGEGGSGKNTLVDGVLGAVFGKNQVISISQEEMKNFNGQMAGKMIVMFDESIAAKTDMERFKAILSNKTLNINPKYGKPYTAENMGLYFAGSNGSMGAVYLDRLQSDRRFSILKVTRSIIDHVMDIKSLNRNAALEWWMERKDMLTDKNQVAMWLNHIIEFSNHLTKTPEPLHGEDYQALLQTQAGVIEWIVSTVFEHPEFTFIGSKECFKLYELKCDEYGSRTRMAKPAFMAKLGDILHRDLKYIVKNERQKVITDIGRQTTQSGWVNRNIKGAIDISKICFVDEDEHFKGKYVINDEPFATTISDKKTISPEDKKLMDD
jgi:hypothetical protein